ncbi:MAG: aa3-type cytochrome c oxidase subunit IV [Rhodomicrobium sp.]|nr:aa3-type cytochrome c oxidase subunit IV [Rhodomicrobium sp.]
MNIDMTAANENMDMPAHVKTYRNFMTLVKYSIATVVIILIAMAFFLT